MSAFRPRRLLPPVRTGFGSIGKPASLKMDLGECQKAEMVVLDYRLGERERIGLVARQQIFVL